MTKTGNKIVEVGVREVRHVPFARAMHTDPHRIHTSPPPLSKRYLNFLSELLRSKLKGRKKGGGVIVDSADVKNASAPIRDNLDSMDTFRLLAKPSRYLMVINSPLGWDSTLPREVEGEIAACHCAVENGSKGNGASEKERTGKERQKWSAGKRTSEMEHRKRNVGFGASEVELRKWIVGYGASEIERRE